MNEVRYIAYYRVSTDKQGKSGLGLDAQRETVRAFLRGVAPLAEFTEVESGKRDDRPQLALALARCRLVGATLVVAKLDRLARNAKFLLTIVDGADTAGVVFCDLPTIPAGPVGRFMLTQMAAVAELEAGLISQRTKAALAEVKARGVKLGGYRGGPKVDCAAGTAARKARADAFAGRVRPMVTEMRALGMAYAGIAAELDRQGVKTPRGGAWNAAGVRDVLLRGA